MTATPIYSFSLFLALALNCSAASASGVELPRTTGEIVVDGVMDEDAWQNATEVELIYETEPGENIAARLKTHAYIMEDGINLYVGFAASDPDPSAIRAYLRDRDSAWDDDYVGIMIDTYNDGHRAVEFYSTPLGVQMDVTYDESSLQGGDFGKEDDSWDAIWDSAGQVNADGYVVEIRIPLTQLRFPATDGIKTWGLFLYRSYPRDKTYAFSNIPHDRGNNCFLCQFISMRGLEDVTPGRDLEVVPTLTMSRSDATENPGVDPLLSKGTTTEAGLSLRWGITPDLTANLAINPDFSQVEADVAQLDVNERFALFYPEKRPFFLEGANYFSTPMRTVFTRTIGSPDVGTKLTGKRGDHTFGVLLVEDAVTNLLFPGVFGSDSTTLEQSNTAMIGRYSRGFGQTSSLGGVVTVRNGDGYHNYLAGVDMRWKLSDRHTLTAQIVESETVYPLATALEFSQPVDTFDGNATLASYEYDSRNWFGNVQYASRSSGFRADSGFMARVGEDLIVVDAGRVWHGEDGSRWSRVSLATGYEIAHLEDGRLREKSNVLRLRVQGPLQSFVHVAYRMKSELENDVMFDLKRAAIYTELTPRSGISLSLGITMGDQIDYDNTRLADERSVEPAIDWNISRNLLLRLRGIFAGLDTKQGEKIFDAAVVDARLTWQFNVRSFLRFTVQQADTSRNPAVYLDPVESETTDVGRQLLYSYKINPQTVLFLGYSDQFYDDDSLNKLTVSDRSLFMKLGYAWNL
ncbi:MAG: carbohydrate binding family 9 domain-containing protein [Gammaproteobacteria bacterium]|nr:carbohydrate binding family 9 domain-containing protein [Gammaproteobacteria bacterium]MDH5239898.1 carbohydrate binding family 9 domain-containing protein [Gammaproteobacteria bacterium]MDH5582331.1 carbohydrate binding family 9 domain-containing protein [Gammaproteobacteria bacterium]